MSAPRKDQPSRSSSRRQTPTTGSNSGGAPDATGNAANGSPSPPASAPLAADTAPPGAASVLHATSRPNPNIGVGFSPNPLHMDRSLYEGLDEVYTVCTGGMNGVFPDWDFASLAITGYSGAFALRWTDVNAAFDHYEKVFDAKQTVIAQPTSKHLKRLAARDKANKTGQGPSSPSSSIDVYGPFPTPAQRSQYPSGHALNPIYFSPSPSPRRPAATANTIDLSRPQTASTPGNTSSGVTRATTNESSNASAAAPDVQDAPPARQRHFARPGFRPNRGGISSSAPRPFVVDPQLVEEDRLRAERARRRHRELRARAMESTGESRFAAISSAFERINILERMQQQELNRLLELEETVNARAAALALAVRADVTRSPQPASSETIPPARPSSQSGIPSTPVRPSMLMRTSHVSSSTQVTPSLNRNTLGNSNPAPAQQPAPPSTTPARSPGSPSISRVPSKRKTSDAAQTPRPLDRPRIVVREPSTIPRYPRPRADNQSPGPQHSTPRGAQPLAIDPALTTVSALSSAPPTPTPTSRDANPESNDDDDLFSAMLNFDDDVKFSELCRVMDQSEASYLRALLRAREEESEEDSEDVEDVEDVEEGEEDEDGEEGRGAEVEGDSDIEDYEDALEYL
ncbi:hypothetical protein CVT26_006161 [Gymnopilus dilepis]|uniref:Uncharacterized protein n=1 Tax=Gymnopilus dilepis TaxID=231916 RepID=A0A409WGD3_9AGAR|nr:hypothetical protein CVT26_006161 [Gymnopilus dilepis]